ncbi:MAG: hypothetical protein ACXWVQ_00015 [Methyloceanibacter sp.]
MVRNLLLALGLVAGLSAWLAHGAADAADPAFCGKYASDAMKAVSQANYLKCGFKGPRWTGDKKNHLAWCLFVPSGAAKFETDARANDLKLCTCQWYADQTMVQIAMNIAKKCKFTGLRWLDSKKAHYNWCFNANPPFSAMQNEMDIRKKMLKGC